MHNRIKDLHEDADKKQSEIAEALFMHQTQYGRYEREIPLNLAIMLAKYNNVSLDYIAGLTNVKRSFSEHKPTAEDLEIIHGFRALTDFEKGQVFERIMSLVEKFRSV